MQDLITSFIIQSKECKLAEIGKFSKVTTPAKTDIANKQIIPSITQIVFNKREERISDGLIKYVADKKNISSSEALNEIKKWCSNTKAKLKNGESILFKSIGFLKNDSSGITGFEIELPTPVFIPVDAERVIHKNSEHSVLVGDKETTSSVMNQFYSEEEIHKNKAWKIIALVLLIVALILLFFHFYGHPFSITEFGNQGKIVPQSPPATYK